MGVLRDALQEALSKMEGARSTIQEADASLRKIVIKKGSDLHQAVSFSRDGKAVSAVELKALASSAEENLRPAIASVQEALKDLEQKRETADKDTLPPGFE